MASRTTHATDTRFFRAISLSSRCCSAVRLTDRRCADLSSLAMAVLVMAAVLLHQFAPRYTSVVRATRCFAKTDTLRTRTSHAQLSQVEHRSRGDECSRRSFRLRMSAGFATRLHPAIRSLPSTLSSSGRTDTAKRRSAPSCAPCKPAIQPMSSAARPLVRPTRRRSSYCWTASGKPASTARRGTRPSRKSPSLTACLSRRMSIPAKSWT